MTHLTPGAKALYLKDKGDGTFEQIPVTIHEVTKSHVVYYDETSSAHQRNTTTPDFCFRPLISATITEDGKAREVNPLTKPEKWKYQYEDQSVDPDYDHDLSAWSAAEASRRTWELYEVVITIPGERAIEVGKTFKNLPLGTPVLGYEKEGEFVIVEVEKS